MKKLRSLKDDIKVTNKLKAFRADNGFQSPRNPIPWTIAYLTVLVASTYPSEGKSHTASIDEAKETLKSIGLEYTVSAANFLAKCVDQFVPTEAREYANNLPTIVKQMGLRYDRKFNHDKCEWEWHFWFRNSRTAYRVLTVAYPSSLPLFELLDNA